MVLPAGLLIGSVIFDVAAMVVTDDHVLLTTANYSLASGIIAGTLAAPGEAIDFAAIPARTRAKRIGLLHGAANILVLSLFAISWALRRADPASAALSVRFISVLAVALIGLAAWFGGELVSRLGIGVADSASLNAPSSLDRTDL